MSFDMVLDEPSTSDTVEVHDGITFVIENRILNSYGPFAIHSYKRGNHTYLDIKTDKDTGGGGGGCDSCTTCG